MFGLAHISFSSSSTVSSHVQPKDLTAVSHCDIPGTGETDAFIDGGWVNSHSGETRAIH